MEERFRSTSFGSATSGAGAGGKKLMRGAFIVQLGPETQPAEGRFEGWVQEVDLCCEQRFHSADELMKFLGERFESRRACG